MHGNPFQGQSPRTSGDHAAKAPPLLGVLGGSKGEDGCEVLVRCLRSFIMTVTTVVLSLITVMIRDSTRAVREEKSLSVCLLPLPTQRESHPAGAPLAAGAHTATSCKSRLTLARAPVFIFLASVRRGLGINSPANTGLLAPKRDEEVYKNAEANV